MRRSITLLVLGSLALAVPMAPAAGDPYRAAVFTIDLDDVPKERARNDLLNLFIREQKNQLRIDMTLVNRRESAGRARPTLYYLEDLRVKPGDTLRIEPKGRTPAFEGEIKTVEAFFPAGKPPQIRIVAFGKPLTPARRIKPYPQVSSENFRGIRTLQQTVDKSKERVPDLITCNGDTPGDLRIRFQSIIEVEDVGRAFSTRYTVDDVRHTYDPTNGLRTRYFGTRLVKRTGR